MCGDSVLPERFPLPSTGLMTRGVLLAAFVLPAAAQKVDWVQTARFKDGSTNLLQDMPAVHFEPMPEPPTELTLELDTSKTYQEILGFGGAFTEASAINWRKLSEAEQAEVIRLYFASPEDGGHGYTLGRVPINSCDFSPASYSFDSVPDDVSLAHFDHDVTHDVEVGMIPMIKQAQDAVEKRGYKFNMYASPWSPPAWMKAPVGGLQSMLLSATPNGLLPSMQRVWANYFSKFIDAYSKHGINFWGVTVQNEPEAAVGWEACLWTPEYMASFVRDHLGPVLEKDHPEVKIIGFDHNKDHVDIWAQGLYADPEAAKYFYGIGVHWYGGLNTQKLDYTHNLDPTKVILGTEACNCGGVVYRDAAFADGELTKGDFLPAWWSRAESLALDILEDLRYWAVGWTDWNLVLSIDGGPNHLKNLCDANIIIDNEHQVGSSNLIMQASYYYMGHFSRYFLPGSKRIHLTNSVEAEGGSSLQPGDVKNGQALLFAPCDGNDAQKWRLNEDGQIIIRGTNEAESSDGYEKGGACIDVVHGGWVDGKLQVWACNDPPPFEKQPTTTDAWTVVSVPGGSQILHAASGKCITAVQTDGGAVGLDKGLTIVAGQLKACLVKGTPSQTFTLANYDAQGFPSNFPVKTLPTAPGGGELCLQPQIVRMPHFDAVAFQAPDGDVALVAMNTGDHAVEFTLVDKVTESGIRSLTIPPHAIHTYRWNPTMGSSAALLSLATKVESGTKFEGSGRKPSAYVTPSPLLWAVALVIGVAGTGAATFWTLRKRQAASTLLDGSWPAAEYEEFRPPQNEI